MPFGNFAATLIADHPMSALSTFDSTVNSVYLAFFGRPADPAGLAFWSKQLAENNGDLRAITPFFASSEEAQVRFGTDTVTSRIGEIYEQLFNRTPDAAGLAFWANAVEQGHATLADVSIAILNGAQGTDQTLSSLRQQAADAFTASVDASGSAYSGYASIEAARVLVRAVTLDATAADLDALVKAGVSFADTATKTPQVVEAIATGSTLLGLFDTGRGQNDPVGLARMLADTAKAAAGNPVTLESLLRGGGIDKVLKVMPSSASLLDVVDALAKGGLAAAIKVVYPSAPVVKPPVADIKLDFLAVTQGDGDTHTDHVTKLAQPAVAFTYQGRELAAGEKFEFSLDNIHWTGKDIELVKQSYANIVAISGIDLSQGSPLNAHPSFTLQGIGNTDDLGTTVYLRVVDGNGKVVTAISQDIVYDHFAAAPTLAANKTDANNLFALDHVHVRDIQQIVRSGIESGATVEYLGAVDVISGEGKWSTAQPEFAEGENTIRIRQTDAAGNVSETTTFTFTLDHESPAAPSVALVVDTGRDSKDGITSIPMVTISGLEKSDATGWQYSTDKGASWTFGGVNGNSDRVSLNLTVLEVDSATVYVRQIDAAGNTSDPTALSFTIDQKAPENTISFVGITGEQPGVFVTTAQSVALTLALDADKGDSIEWRTKGASTWQTAQDNETGTFTIAGIDLVSADPTIEVRRVDAAGNASEVSEQLIDGPWTKPSINSNFARAEYYLNADASAMRLFSTPYGVVQATGAGSEAGFLDRDGIALLDASGATSVPTATDYTSGVGFSMNENTEISFNAPLLTNVYQLTWASNSIETIQGTLNAGLVTFAGGVDGNIVLEGFTVKQKYVGNDDFSSPDTTVANEMIVVSGGATSHIATGGGHDVIVDDGATVHLDYTVFDSASSDLVIGFDSGSDTVNFKGGAGLALDENNDGKIFWAPVNDGVKTFVEPVHEGIEIQIGSAFSTRELSIPGSAALASLNEALDLTIIDGVLQQDLEHMDFLILAHDLDGTGGALLYFQNLNDNAKIEAGEISLIAVFTEGMPSLDDIHVVGTMID